MRGVIFIMMALVLCYVMSDCLTLSYVLFYCDYGKLLDTYFLQELRFLVFRFPVWVNDVTANTGGIY